MFRDKKEELRRLEAELLREAQAEEEDTRLEEELEEAEELLDDPCDYGEESEETYYNYSNRYGRVKAYNSDRTDENLDSFSDRVYAPRRDKRIGRLAALAACLLAGIVVMLGWCVLKIKGIL